MDDHGDFTTLPSLLPFTQRFVSHITSQSAPASIFIHAPHHAELVLPLLQLLLSKHLVTPPRSSPPSIQDLLPKVAVVDLEEVHTTRTAFDIALNRFSGWSKDGEAGAWSEAEGKVENWERRTDGLEVVRSGKRLRRQGGPAGQRKRARREDSDDDELVVERPEEEEEEEEDEDDREGDDEEWTLSWNRRTPLPKDRIAPIRDTLEYFHAGLVVVSTLSTSNDDCGKENSLLRLVDSGEPTTRRWLIFDHAEGLSDLAAAGNAGGAPKETGMGMTLSSSVHRIGELSEALVTSIIISRHDWTKARDAMVGLAAPVLLAFPALSGPDAVKILASRFASSSPTSTMDRPTLVALFSSLASVIYETFGSLVQHDLSELSRLCAKFWPKWLLCVTHSNPPIPPTDTARLNAQLKSDFTLERQRLSTPHTSAPTTSVPPPMVLQGFAGTMPALPSLPPPLDAPLSHSPFPLRRQVIAFAPSAAAAPLRAAATGAADQSLARSLPELAKWLLLASFYAGFNPVKSDVRIFVKVDEGIAKKGNKGRKKSAPKPGVATKTTLRTELVGGKTFPLERLLGIFEAILGERHDYASQCIDVLMQVTTLINLRLLQRVSGQGPDKVLDGVKLKCKLTRDTVDMLARSIGVADWAERLWDTDRD